jgi:tRNA (cmo5U34)-methyltransferase
LDPIKELILPEESQKSSVEEIRQRFDKDVERFSNLDTGQSTIVDSALMMELTAQAAAAITPQASHLLDVGCGAGNSTLKLLQLIPDVNLTLVDLSRPMLDRAVERIRAVSKAGIHPLQGDIRELEFKSSYFDIILAAAVLHHLRDDSEWQVVFKKFYDILKPGGSVWIVDMIKHTNDRVNTLMGDRYSDYLIAFKDKTFRDRVYAYIEREDTPRSLPYQLDLLKQVGFETVEILHKTNIFAAFGAVK